MEIDKKRAFVISSIILAGAAGIFGEGSVPSNNLINEGNGAGDNTGQILSPTSDKETEVANPQPSPASQIDFTPQNQTEGITVTPQDTPAPKLVKTSVGNLISPNFSRTFVSSTTSMLIAFSILSIGVLALYKRTALGLLN